jgi:hypothetical protein
VVNVEAGLLLNKPNQTMTTDAFINIVKTLSTLAGLGFGILALLKETKNKSGKISEWGKIAVIGIFYTGVLSLTLQMLESGKAKQEAIESKAKSDSTTKLLFSIIKKADSTIYQQTLNLDTTKLVATRVHTALNTLALETKRTKTIYNELVSSLTIQKQLLNHALREHYPLEPIAIYYQKVYPMNHPIFRAFIKRTKQEIITLPDPSILAMTDMAHDSQGTNHAYITCVTADPRPNRSKDEFLAWLTLAADCTDFIFECENKGSVIFSSTEDLFAAQIYNKNPSNSIVKQTVQLTLDFRNQTIIKDVQISNPLRSGNDVLSFSALDLINSTLSWRFNSEFGPKERLTKIGFKFKNDPEWQDFRRYIEIPKSETSLIITSSTLGLDKLVTNK